MKQTLVDKNVTSFTETVKEITHNLFNKGHEESQTSKKAENHPPLFINYITLNRLGLTKRNLTRILATEEDFEMHIIDSNSKDSSWDYVQSLGDKRIKSKTKLDLNRGPIYPLNLNLTKRRPDQYFMTIDSDVYIKTDNWISRFMEVFNAFPKVGVLGVMRDNPYPRYMPPIIPRVKGDIAYLELKNAEVGVDLDFVPGHLQCLRPELIDEIGYWCEEDGYGDAELSPRVSHYTSFKVGYLTTVEIDMKQFIGCDECQAREFCKLSKSINTCFTLSKKANMNESFVRRHGWKYLEIFKELEEGKRTAYCASIHDPESIKNHVYNQEWANENFNYYIENSNSYSDIK
ncbi:MAG TPA: glycosyltransferase family A protein [Ruminiclostridium sp.]|nr:glycosyltransferase family A protein [Ruminiclostridium sp.]